MDPPTARAVVTRPIATPMYSCGTFSVIISYDATVAQLIMREISMTTIVDCKITLELGPAQRSAYQTSTSAD
jgi:hypothetical protein